MELAAPAVTAFRDAALEVGRRLLTGAVWHDDRCTWFGDDIEDDGEIVYRSAGVDLYGGTSGIGWFLAGLAAATADDEVAATARGALRHALARAHETTGAGLHAGLSGIALAAVTGGRALGDGDIAEEGRRLADRAAEVSRDEAGAGLDLIGGVAGTSLALLELSRALDDERLLDVVADLGERLLEPPPADTSEPDLCGLGHGASGMALACLELEAALGDRRFGEAALAAIAYERQWFSPQHANWPDLRELDRARLEAEAGPAYLVYWCHGAAGIGLVRLRAYERTGEELLLAEAGAAIDTATATMLRALTAPDGTPTGIDLTLCHGVGSVAELQLAAAKTTGDLEHLDHARRLVRLAVCGRDETSELRLPEELPCGVPGGGETSGLMVGIAGIGALLLRLYDPTLLPSPALVDGWAEMSEGCDGRVAPDLRDAGVPLELGDDTVV